MGRFRIEVIGLICLVISCRQKIEFSPYYSEENSRVYTKEKHLKSYRIIAFELDSVTRFHTNSIHVTLDDERELLSFLDAESSRIHVYDYHSQQKLPSISMDVDGPNGVGAIGFPSYHLLAHPDSLYVYNISTGILYHLDSSAKVKNKFNLTDFSDFRLPVPYPSTTTPAYRVGRKIIFPCGLNDYQSVLKDYPSVLELDLTTKNIKYLTTFSSYCGEAFWGSFFKYEPSFAVNPRTQQLVLNYPVDPWLYSYEQYGNGSAIQWYVGSEEFGAVHPYSADPLFFQKRNNREIDERENEYAFSTSEYRSIIYDPFRDLYYRMALIRPSIEAGRNGDLKPDFSIIILDSNFKKLGEQFFSKERYDPSSVFFSSVGINIFRRDLYQKNEEKAFFEVFIPDEVL